MSSPATSTGPASSGGWWPIWTIGGVVALALLAGQCSSDASDPAENRLELTNAGFSDAVEEPPAQRPVEPLGAEAVARGTAHLRSAHAAEGLAGALIYSRNCFNALARTFSWAKLDSCGAGDMMAADAILADDSAALPAELDYFEAETAAGRYLAAALAGGEAAAEADLRLADLQTRIRRYRPLVAARSAAAAAPPSRDWEVEPAPADEQANASLDSDWLDRALNRTRPARAAEATE